MENDILAHTEYKKKGRKPRVKYYQNNPYTQLQADISGVASLHCPEKIYLDITEDCNLHCQMCRETVEASGKIMPMELFKRIVDETSPYCKSYSLFNWGEPLLLSDFKERTRYVFEKKRSDCNIEISTNGMLLTDEMVRFLRQYEIRVIISFDGANKETFEKIRCGANYELICKHARSLNQAYEDASLDIAPASYTSIQRDNQAELPEIVQVVCSLGFRRIGFGLVTCPAKYAPEVSAQLIDGLHAAYNYIDEYDMFLELYPARVGEYLYWGDKYVPADDFVVSTRCDAPLRSVTISYNGDVCLCCNFGTVAGNLKEHSFLDAWNSQQYDDLRETVNQPDNAPAPCRNCWWVNRWEGVMEMY